MTEHLMAIRKQIALMLLVVAQRASLSPGIASGFRTDVELKVVWLLTGNMAGITPPVTHRVAVSSATNGADVITT